MARWGSPGPARSVGNPMYYPVIAAPLVGARKRSAGLLLRYLGDRSCSHRPLGLGGQWLFNVIMWFRCMCLFSGGSRALTCLPACAQEICACLLYVWMSVGGSLELSQALWPVVSCWLGHSLEFRTYGVHNVPRLYSLPISYPFIATLKG